MLGMSPEDLEKATPSLLGTYPNTYTFTKALAEELLVRFASQKSTHAFFSYFFTRSCTHKHKSSRRTHHSIF